MEEAWQGGWAWPGAAAGLEGSTREETQSGQISTSPSASVLLLLLLWCFFLSAAAYKDGPWCRGGASRGSGGCGGSSWGALVGGDVEGRSAGLSGNALL